MTFEHTPMSRLRSEPIIFCDFDGTVTRADVTDEILEEFADPSWRELERRWVQGKIGSRECLARQMELVRASSLELDALIDSVPVDPHFAHLCRFAEQVNVPFCVVSDGFDYVIARILARCEADGALQRGHVYANSLSLKGGRMAVDFPHGESGCCHGCALCKPAIMRCVGEGRSPVVFIGDGWSDRFAVEAAHLIFAKRQLAAHCRDQGIPFQAFDTLADVREELARRWLRQPKRRRELASAG